MHKASKRKEHVFGYCHVLKSARPCHVGIFHDALEDFSFLVEE